MIISNKVMRGLYLISIIFIFFLIIFWVFSNLTWSENRAPEVLYIQAYIKLPLKVFLMVLFLYLTKKYSIRVYQGKIYFFFALNWLGWTVSEIIWFFEDYKWPGYSDIPFLISFIFLIIALGMQKTLFKVSFSFKEKMVIIIVIVICAIVLLLCNIMVPIIYNLNYNLLEWFLTLIYPILDLIVLYLIIVIYIYSRKGEIHTSLKLLIIGTFFHTFLGDTIYIILWALGIVSTFNYAQIFYIIGYIITILACFKVINILNDVSYEINHFSHNLK